MIQMPDENEHPSFPAPDLAKLLFQYTQENDTFVRHYEEIRFKVSQVTVTLAGLLIGATRLAPVTLPPAAKLPISLFIIALGLIGITISAKYSERADRHATIARAYRRAASDVIKQAADMEPEKIHQGAAAMHASRSPLLSLIRARYFWYAVHACVILLGIIVGYI